MKKNLIIYILLLSVSSALWGCDPLTTHKITSTIFDGVPTLPEPEEYCREYHEKKLNDEAKTAIALAQQADRVRVSSIHKPYEEKACNKCHDKTKDSGLIVPASQLCFTCHTNIAKSTFVHGPAAVGGCIECHEPHSTSTLSLLKTEGDKLCATCHQEKRSTEKLHLIATKNSMHCTDCHDPHSGDVKFFLK